MSEFWQKKMKTYFKRIDFDHDGVITRKDFEGMADRFIKTGKFDDKKAADLTGTLLALWSYYAGAAGKDEKDDKATISNDEFIGSMKKLLADKDHPEKLAGPLPLFFHAVDSNCDEMIDADEYGKFFEILGLDPKMAPATFKAIDENSDGLLSLQEFKDAGVAFFTAVDDKSPTKVFWGPLE